MLIKLLTITIKCMIFQPYTNTHSHQLKDTEWLVLLQRVELVASVRLLSAPLVCWIRESFFLSVSFVPSAPNCPGQRSRFLCRAFVWPDRTGQDSWRFAPMEGQLCKRERSMKGFSKVWLLLSLCCFGWELRVQRLSVILAPLCGDGGDTLSFHHACVFWHHVLADVVCVCVCVCMFECKIDGSTCLDLLPFSPLLMYQSLSHVYLTI